MTAPKKKKKGNRNVQCSAVQCGLPQPCLTLTSAAFIPQQWVKHNKTSFISMLNTSLLNTGLLNNVLLH